MKKNFIIVFEIILILIMGLFLLINIYNNSQTEINDAFGKITFSKEEILNINRKYESYYGINNSEKIKELLQHCIENYIEQGGNVRSLKGSVFSLKIPTIKYITDQNIMTLNVVDEQMKQEEYYDLLNNMLENIPLDKSYNVEFKYTTSLTEPGDDVSLIYEIDIMEFDGTSENLNTIQMILKEEELRNKKQSEKSPEKVNVEVNEDSVSKTGGILVITDNNKNPYTWDDVYIIEKKIDSNWEKIETKKDIINEENYIGKDYNVDENNQIILEIDWTPYYGELSSGTYRIVKTARYNNEEVEFRSNQFIIEE